MPTQTTPWENPDWLAQVESWLEIVLAQHQFTLTGPIEQPHERPWSTVLTIPTDQGLLYFKATAPALGYEPALTEALSQWYPDWMPQVIATELEQGWLLMHDAGQPLRHLIQADQSIDHTLKVLPHYAEIQIDLANRVETMRSFGLLDRCLAQLPSLYQHLLADTEALLIDQPEGLTHTAYQRLLDLTPHVIEMCQQLATYNLPETLHHDDFHDANIFVKDGRITFADWGESCLGHPFFTLVIILRSNAYQLKLGEESPELDRLRDAYLEPWTRFETRQSLISASKLAHRLGMVCRTLTWYHLVSSLTEPLKSTYAEAVPGWLQEFLAGRLTAED